MGKSIPAAGSVTLNMVLEQKSFLAMTMSEGTAMVRLYFPTTKANSKKERGAAREYMSSHQEQSIKVNSVRAYLTETASFALQMEHTSNASGGVAYP